MDGRHLEDRPSATSQSVSSLAPHYTFVVDLRVQDLRLKFKTK